MSRKVLACMLMIGLIGLAGLGTYAYFSSTRTENPGFYTANLNLELGVDYPWETLLDKMAPGEDREQVFRLSTSEGSIGGSYSELEISYEMFVPTIDGVIEEGWDQRYEEADKLKVFVTNDDSYLYMAFDVVNDPTDARLGENLVGNDQCSVNIGFAGDVAPYRYIFQTATNYMAFNPQKYSLYRGETKIDGYFGQWQVNKDPTKPGGPWGMDHMEWKHDMPYYIEACTSFVSNHRQTEWKIPLDAIGASVGDTLRIGGATESPDGVSLRYPGGLVWSDGDTFMPYIVKGDIGDVITVKVEQWPPSGWETVDPVGSTLKQWAGYKMKILDDSDGVGAVKVTLHFKGEEAGNEYQSICGQINFTFTLWQGP